MARTPGSAPTRALKEAKKAARRQRKIALKVKKMTKVMFEADKEKIRSKIAKLLGISADRIEIALKAARTSAVARRLLLVPLNEIETDAESEAEPASEIEVTVKDPETTGSTESSEVSADTAVKKIESLSAAALTKDLGIEVAAKALVLTATPSAAPTGTPSTAPRTKTTIATLAVSAALALIANLIM